MYVGLSTAAIVFSTQIQIMPCFKLEFVIDLVGAGLDLGPRTNPHRKCLGAEGRLVDAAALQKQNVGQDACTLTTPRKWTS